MTGWIDIGPEHSLAEGERIIADLDGLHVAVFKLDGELYAIEDVCTHDGGELASGAVEGCEIICPRHGARFCIKTGEVLKPPAYEALNCFPVRVENGTIQIQAEP